MKVFFSNKLVVGSNFINTSKCEFISFKFTLYNMCAHAVGIMYSLLFKSAQDHMKSLKVYITI